MIVRGGVTNTDGDDIFDVSVSGDGGGSYSSVTATEIVNANFTTEANVDAPPGGGGAAADCTADAGGNFGQDLDLRRDLQPELPGQGRRPSQDFHERQCAHPDHADRRHRPARLLVLANDHQGRRRGSQPIRIRRRLAHRGPHRQRRARRRRHPERGLELDELSDRQRAVICVDTPNNTAAGIDTESFSVPAPAAVGSYDLTLVAYSDNGGPGVGCEDRASAPAVIPDGIVVGIFGDSFGIGASSTVAGWTDGDAGGTSCAISQTGSGATVGYSHLRLRSGCMVTKSGVSTAGRTGVHLKYKWGQSTDNDVSTDGDLVVQWKLNALPDVPPSWTTVNTHALANNTTTDPTTNAVDAALGLLAENTSIDVRLIGATPEANDQGLGRRRARHVQQCSHVRRRFGVDG